MIDLDKLLSSTHIKILGNRIFHLYKNSVTSEVSYAFFRGESHVVPKWLQKPLGTFIDYKFNKRRKQNV